MDKVTEYAIDSIKSNKAVRIDGGSAGVFYAETEQEFWSAVSVIRSIGSGYSIEVIKK